MAPLPLITAVAAPRALPEQRADPAAPRPDGGGAVLVTLGLMATLFGLTRVERQGVAAVVTLVPLLAGAVALAGFVAWERRVPAPLVRFGILRVRSLRLASLGAGVNSIAFTAIVYVGTLYLQGPLNYGPLRAGLALLPVDVVAFVVPLVAAGAATRSSPRALLAGSFALTTLALLWMARAPQPAHYPTDILAPLVALGASLSIAFVVLNQEAVAEVEPEEKGLASGIFETANCLVGGAIGVAVYATVLAAAGHGAAFLTAAGLAALGLPVAFAIRDRAAAGRTGGR
jgi:hypothetical protein